MKIALKTLQESRSEQVFKFDELYPYPYDKSIMVMPFPKHFEMPKFDKCKGKGDPRYHVKEFFMAFQEVSWCENYLLQLFPKSLSGPTLEWFSKLSFDTINMFVDLSKQFVAQYHTIFRTMSPCWIYVKTNRKGVKVSYTIPKGGEPSLLDCHAPYQRLN